MDQANWTQISAVLGEALAIEGSAERAAFLDARCRNLPALRAEVDALLMGYAAGESLEQSAVAGCHGVLLPGALIGAYRIVEEVGAGGMGVVYRAERADGQFDRTVAVKVIAAGLLTQDAVRHFRAERAILAALKHPHITELLDAGLTPSGLPYLVMEFVSGEPIGEYCQRRRLSIPECAALLEQVCNAVHYAHQRLVIHRDLKLANILVDSEGRSKLLDFGIARILDAPSSGDQTRDFRRFTPSFASPEQLRGEPLSTGSDVYSLGVILYHLLAKKHPYDVTNCTLAAAIHIVSTVDPPPLHPEAPADLDAIVRKAMAKSPDERYDSAQALALDLACFREGRPVSAHPPSFLYLAKKFIARNIRAVTAACTVFLLLTASLAATLLQYRTAQQERQKAELRFKQVRQLANSILFEFQPDLAKLSGAIEVRRKMVARSLEHLELLSRDATELDLRYELAVAYSRLGDIQGGVNWSLGDRTAAFDSYTKSRALLEGILRQQPDYRNAARDNRTLLSRMAVLARAAGWQDKADALGREVAAITEDLYRRLPFDEEAMEAMANLQFQRSAAAPAARVSHLEQSLALFEKLLTLHPADARRMYDVAVAAKTLASAYIDARLPGKALTVAERAVNLDQARVSADPLDARARLDLTYSLGNLAYLEKSTRRPRAIQLFRELVAIRKGLYEAEPQNSRLCSAYVSGLNQLANALTESGAHREADQLYRTIIQFIEKNRMNEATDRRLLEHARNAIQKKQ